jgi:hypothetical protein
MDRYCCKRCGMLLRIPECWTVWICRCGYIKARGRTSEAKTGAAAGTNCEIMGETKSRGTNRVGSAAAPLTNAPEQEAAMASAHIIACRPGGSI